MAKIELAELKRSPSVAAMEARMTAVEVVATELMMENDGKPCVAF